MVMNLKRHEHVGLLLVFIAASWLGLGLYSTLLAANRLLLAQVPLIAGKELLIFPIFYGLGAILLILGGIELREALPGKNRGL
jgi:nitric oxide reductase large subunit